MTGATIGFHYVTLVLEGCHVDVVIVWIVHQLERVVAAIDAVGVLCAAGVSLYRFVRALMEDGSRATNKD